MNVVFHRYNSICEPGYVDAFKALGLSVIEDRQEMTDKNIPPDVRIKTIAELILKERPLFVFSINFFPYISDICEKLNCLYVCVSVDCPVAELSSRSIRNSHNRIFLFDHAQYLETVSENPGGVFHLPLGVMYGDREYVEPGSFTYDVSFIGSLYEEKNPYSDMFGKLSPRVQGLCEGLLGAQELLGGMDLLETIFGGAAGDLHGQKIIDEILSEVRDFVPDVLKDDGLYVTGMSSCWALNNCFGFELTVRDRMTLIATLAEGLAGEAGVHLFTRSSTDGLRRMAPSLITHGGVSTLTEMPGVIRSSRINLNTTMRPIRTGLPQRIWDVLGFGGFLLTNWQSEIPDSLTVGTHLEAYETPEEAIEKIRHYLSNEDERMEIARRGHAEAVSRHGVLNRVAVMIERITASIERHT